MPANTAALVVKALPGAELACRGHGYDLPVGDNAMPSGVVSYCATAAFAGATTLGDWLTRIESLVNQDTQAGRLPVFFRPDLHVLGDVDQPVP